MGFLLVVTKALLYRVGWKKKYRKGEGGKVPEGGEGREGEGPGRREVY